MAASQEAFVNPRKAILSGLTPFSKAVFTIFSIKKVVLPVPGGPKILWIV